MTTPRHSFRAHDRCGRLGRQELIERLRKFASAHVIGVPAKLIVAPCRIRRIGQWIAAAAELPNVDVFDSVFGQRPTQRLARKMRIPSRSGETPNVSQPLDSM